MLDTLVDLGQRFIATGIKSFFCGFVLYWLIAAILYLLTTWLKAEVMNNLSFILENHGYLICFVIIFPVLFTDEFIKPFLPWTKRRKAQGY